MYRYIAAALRPPSSRPTASTAVLCRLQYRTSKRSGNSSRSSWPVGSQCPLPSRGPWRDTGGVHHGPGGLHVSSRVAYEEPWQASKLTVSSSLRTSKEAGKCLQPCISISRAWDITNLSLTVQPASRRGTRGRTASRQRGAGHGEPSQTEVRSLRQHVGF